MGSKHLKANHTIFGVICQMLNIQIEVKLFIHADPPQNLANDTSHERLPGNLTLKEKMEGVTGCWGPACRDLDGPPEYHAIWVRSTLDEDEANVAFVHELTHAAQCEQFPTVRLHQVENERLYRIHDYLNHPFELEAESMARFIVLHLGLRPLYR